MGVATLCPMRRSGKTSSAKMPSGSPRSRGRALPTLVLLSVTLVGLLSPAAGLAGGFSNQLGKQDRANAASQTLVLAVQRGISSLPPASGQSFVYEFNPSVDVFVRSEQLGPVSFRTPQTVGRGNLTARIAASYFSLSEELGPIDYMLEFDLENPPLIPQAGFLKFGTRVEADVGVVNLSLNYGVSDLMELTGSLPVVIIQTKAGQIHSAHRGERGVLGVSSTREGLQAALEAGHLELVTQPFEQLGASFNAGTHAGVGRINIGLKSVLLRRDPIRLAFSTELFFPSPSERDFAGSNSVAILPRVIAATQVAKQVRLHLDLGYDYDVDVDELRRVVWNVGASLALKGMTLDCGVGGSNFNSGIEWTPRRARGVTSPSLDVADITVTALENTALDTNFVDFLTGARVQITPNAVVSGAVTVPLNAARISPAVVGTVAIEVYF